MSCVIKNQGSKPLHETRLQCGCIIKGTPPHVETITLCFKHTQNAERHLTQIIVEKINNEGIRWLIETGTETPKNHRPNY